MAAYSLLTSDWERQNPIQCRHSRQPFTHHSQYMLAMLSSAKWVCSTISVYYYSAKWNYYSRALSWPQESQEHAARSVNVWELEVDMTRWLQALSSMSALSSYCSFFSACSCVRTFLFIDHLNCVSSTLLNKLRKISCTQLNRKSKRFNFLFSGEDKICKKNPRFHRYHFDDFLV